MKLVVSLAALVAVVAVVALSQGTPPPGDPEPHGEEDELQYRVDPAALRTEFREVGSFALRVPGLGEIRIAGEQNNLTACRDDACEEHPHLHVLGWVEGHDGSTANILLGEHGVYGSATIPVPDGDNEVRYEFDAVEVDDGYELWVHMGHGSADPDRLS